MRVVGSVGILSRSMMSPQRQFCSSGVIPAYSLKLDHRHPGGVRPARRSPG